MVGLNQFSNAAPWNPRGSIEVHWAAANKAEAVGQQPGVSASPGGARGPWGDSSGSSGHIRGFECGSPAPRPTCAEYVGEWWGGAQPGSLCSWAQIPEPAHFSEPLVPHLKNGNNPSS